MVSGFSTVMPICTPARDCRFGRIEISMKIVVQDQGRRLFARPQTHDRQQGEPVVRRGFPEPDPQASGQVLAHAVIAHDPAAYAIAEHDHVPPNRLASKNTAVPTTYSAVPAKAGTQRKRPAHCICGPWMPAFAGKAIVEERVATRCVHAVALARGRRRLGGAWKARHRSRLLRDLVDPLRGSTSVVNLTCDCPGAEREDSWC